MLDAKILLRIAAEDKKLIEEDAYEKGMSINKYILWRLNLDQLRWADSVNDQTGSEAPNDGGSDGV